MGQPASPGTPNRMRRRWAAVALSLTLAAGAVVSGCGGGDDDAGGVAKTPPKVTWTLVLDYQPNAVHAGIIRALRAGYFDDLGIDLTVVAPSSTSDALTQVGRGKAEVGLADLIDVARRQERAARAGDSSGVSVIGAVVQEPLSGILVSAKSSIRTPADLAGKRIAVTGLPSDIAVVDAIARRGGKPVKTEQITLGFDGLKALDAGRVDAATAYWPADEVTLKGLGTPPRTFSLSNDADVHYPGLVAFVSAATAKAQPRAARAFRDAVRQGTLDVIADPTLGEDALRVQYPELDPAATKAQLTNYVPLFGGQDTAGLVDDAGLTRFADFAAKTGLIGETTQPETIRGAVPVAHDRVESGG